MEFNDNARLDPSQMGGGGGGGGRIAIGGGIGTMIVLFLVSQLVGVDLTSLSGGGSSAPPQATAPNTRYAGCQSGGDIAKNRDCRFVAYTNSIQSYWSQTVRNYQMTQTKTFTGQIQTRCGAATSAVGPFYCPGDQYVYLDTGFFDELTRRFGAKGGDAAEAYVIAHEYGHHISHLTGVMDQAQRSGQKTGPDSPQVRLELQADCYAGVWLRHASDDPNGPIKQVTQQDMANAVDAAQAVGDDRIQEQTQGRVDRESWTHGSAQMRKQWLSTGYSSGDPKKCDTFASNARVG